MSRPIQRILIGEYSDFLTDGGGTFPIQNQYQIFWHYLPNNGVDIKKKTGFFFFTILPKGRGSRPSQKDPYQKKLRWTKKGEGRESQFFDSK